MIGKKPNICAESKWPQISVTAYRSSSIHHSWQENHNKAQELEELDKYFYFLRDFVALTYNAFHAHTFYNHMYYNEQMHYEIIRTEQKYVV